MCLRFVVVKDRVRRGRRTHIFHLLVPSLNRHNSWGWARLKPAVRSFFLVSDGATRTQALGPLPAVAQGMC